MKIKKSALAVALGFGLMLTLAPAAQAATAAPAARAGLTSQNAGGGLFQYGVEGGKVISNYHHAKKYHTATSCNNGLIDRCKQVAASANKWAKSSHASSWLGGNTAYWNVL